MVGIGSTSFQLVSLRPIRFHLLVWPMLEDTFCLGSSGRHKESRVCGTVCSIDLTKHIILWKNHTVSMTLNW
jgi:hypothetical protein